MRCINLFSIVVMMIIVLGNITVANAQTGKDIRLVLQITVDRLRGDLLNRYEVGFGKDGFRYLLDKGTVYTNAR